MSTHRNCPYCGTAEPSRVLIIDDHAITTAMTLAILGIGRAATEAAQRFRQFDVTLQAPEEVHALTVVLADPTDIDPSTHLGPSHRDYPPNHRKQRRSKFKRSGRR